MEHTLTTEPDAAPLAVKAAGFVADRIRLAEHDLPWSSVEIYQVDERVAADGEPERNLTHLRQILGFLPVTLIPMPVTDRLVAVTGPYQGHRRMTLTYPALAWADEIIWLVTGASKHEALNRLLAGDRSIPAARVQARRSVIFADAPAVDGPPPTFQGGHLRRRRRASGLAALPRVARGTAGADGHRVGRLARPDQLLP
jgi:hypothetical protein